MNAYDFFQLVEQMRDKQREYYRTRNFSVLPECKRLERKVDKEIFRARGIIGHNCESQQEFNAKQ